MCTRFRQPPVVLWYNRGPGRRGTVQPADVGLRHTRLAEESKFYFYNVFYFKRFVFS
jgi:hypothetical protein